MESNADKSEQQKRPTRRSPRNHNMPSAALLAAKRNMKQRAMKVRDDDFIKDEYGVAQSAMSMVRAKTGIVYDDIMITHFCVWDSNYPECPERYSSIMNRIKELGLLDNCVRIDSREGTVEEILKKHTPDRIEILKNTATNTDMDQLEKLSSEYDAIFINNASYKTALLSVGCTIDLVDAVIKGNIQNGMAVIRPPGHHAMTGEYCGYCFFNNVALAASHALDAGVGRILIVDWDVHHGQGTQQMFYDDPRVLYFSIHRYENGSFWPNLRESDFDFIGKDNGKGFNFNVPLNRVGMTDADYLAIFQKILMPVAYEFQPELIIVSAGYDAAIGCPEGEMEISPACYAHLTSSLMGLAAGKVAVILEGGYCLKSLSEGAALTLRALQGSPTPQLINFGKPCETIVKTILDVIFTHRPYWHSLQIEEVVPVTCDASELHIPSITYLGDETKPECYPTRNCYPLQSEDFLRNVDNRLNQLQIQTKLIKGPKVGVVTDTAMLLHENAAESDHPEKPERLRSIISKHNEFGLMDRCVPIEPRLATEEELLLVHSEKHVNEMKNSTKLNQSELNSKADSYDSVYLTDKSYECARLSAGSVLQMVDEVLNGNVTSGLAIVRPPGHHAENDAACGFCLFNNVAIAAQYAIDTHNIQRILILDWDVHHGNGIQEIFEEDPRVLYISLHRYNNGRFFPNSVEGNYDKIGTGKGTGFNINIPWNKSGGGMTDGDYIAAFHAIVLPVAYEFQPELVLISAGFDACVNDPLGNCKVTPEAYAHMTHWLMPLAGGRLILALEGGYNVTSISYAMTLCTKALLGDPLPMLGSASTIPSMSALESIRNVIRVHQPFWSSLAFCRTLPNVDVLLSTKLSKAEKEVLNDRLSSLTEGIRTMANDENKEKGAGDSPKPGSSRQNLSGNGAAGPKTLQSYLNDNLELLTTEQMFAVVPISNCPHLASVEPIPETGINHTAKCDNCQDGQENWICLSCYTVQCGRHINAHMMQHFDQTGHPLTLSFADISVWCYECESYIDNPILHGAKNALHLSKFNEEMVWSYGNTD